MCLKTKVNIITTNKLYGFVAYCTEYDPFIKKKIIIIIVSEYNFIKLLDVFHSVLTYNFIFYYV